MKDIIEKEDAEITSAIKGAKILIPFVISLLSIMGVWYDSRTLAALQSQKIIDLNAALIEVKSLSKANTFILNTHSTMIEVVQTDLKYIKDGQDKTYDLLVSLSRDNNH